MTPRRAVDSRAAAAACAAMGRLEYVVESARDDAVQTWFIVRPDRELFPRYRRMGLQMRPGCRIVFEAVSMRPLGVLPPESAPPRSPNGFNPYFDLPPA